MEHRLLEYFVAVVETGSLSRAARRCNISQPSLSQQIMKLEQETGNQLFDRLGRSIQPTEVASILYPQARSILLELQQASVAVRALESLPFIMLHDDHCLRDQIEAFCLVRHINPQVLYRTAPLTTALDFVRLDIGISLVPASAAADYDRDDIAFLRLKGHSPERVIVAASHSGRSDMEGSAAFTAALRASWQRLVANTLN